MAIQVTCAACERQFDVPDELAGQEGACECGATVQIPGGSETVADAAPDGPVPAAPAPAAPAAPAPVPAATPEAESNPYSAPETAVEAAVAPAAGGYDATEIAGLKSCKSGFGLMYISVLLALLAVALIFIGLFTTGSSIQGGSASGAASGGLMVLGAVAAIGIAALLQIIGSGMLMAAPGRSGAKGLFQLSFFSIIGAILLPIFGMDITSLVMGDAELNIMAALGTMLGMFLAVIALQVMYFVGWAVGTSRLSMFVNDVVNAARAKFAIKLFVANIAVFVVGVVAGESMSALLLVVPLAMLVLQIILLIVMLRCYKAGKESIGRVIG